MLVGDTAGLSASCRLSVVLARVLSSRVGPVISA